MPGAAGSTEAAPASAATSTATAEMVPDVLDPELAGSEPVLSADELRALLSENPMQAPDEES